MRFLLIALLAVLAGCRPPDTTGQAAATESTVKLRLEAPQNPKLGPTALRVYLLGANNEAVTGAHVTVTGSMTHAGMAPRVSDALADTDGLYTTRDFAFEMAGDWLLQAEATLPDGSTVTDELPLTVTGN